MEPSATQSSAARRNEDIALDLLKFVAGMTGAGKPSAPSTGFAGAVAPKPDEHVTELLDLYGRCPVGTPIVVNA